MAHDRTQARNDGAVGSDVLHEVAVHLCNHDVLVQLRSRVVEDLRRPFPASENLILFSRERKRGGVSDMKCQTVTAGEEWMRNTRLLWVLGVSHVKGGSSSLLLRNSAGSGSVSHGLKTLPCNFDDLSKIIFSLVGSSRVCRGPLGLGDLDDDDTDDVGAGGGTDAGPVVLSVSANAMRSWHLRLSLVLSAAEGASLTAFMYSSAAWMA